MYYLIFLPLTTFTNQVALPENDSQKKENREINDLSKKKSLNQDLSIPLNPNTHMKFISCNLMLRKYTN